MIRGSEAGRRGTRWEKGHFHFGLLFWEVKGLRLRRIIEMVNFVITSKRSAIKKYTGKC